MCGISGIITVGRPLDLRKLMTMNESLKHRGPDGEGYCSWGDIDNAENLTTNESALIYRSLKGIGACHVAIAHRRLAILDLTDAGRQPMSLENRFWITYNGEIYNFLELASELKSFGYTFQSHSDTEVILAAYDRWGPNCVKRFNGMWALVIVDLTKNKIFASRDRYGMKPLYFFSDDFEFAFASEIKALHLAGYSNGMVNHQKLARFLCYGESDDDRQTCFSQIQQLSPGESFILDLNARDFRGLQLTRYYELPDQISTHWTYDEFCQQLQLILQDSVKIRTISDVEIAACLSGGLDSSSIVGILRNLDSKYCHASTFTSRFLDSRFDEWSFAKELCFSEKTGIQVFPNMDSVWQQIKDLAWVQDEPYRSSSIFAQWAVMKSVHEHNFKVVFDGQGSDEAMAGYHSFIPIYLSQLFKNGQLGALVNAVHSLSKTGLLTASASFWNVALKTAYYSLPLNRLRRTEMTKVLIAEVCELARQGREVSKLDFSNLQRRELSRSLPSLLRYEDRNSMNFSVEARTPFLDHRFVDLAFCAPLEFKFKDGWTKAPLRRAMRGLLPESIALRVDKKGFVTPESTWYASEKEKIESVLTSSSLLPWLNEKQIKPWLADVDRSVKGFAPWRLLSAHFWLEAFSLSL